MNLPPLQPVSNSHFYVSGDVSIDPSAAIAPGSILKADPDSQIVIAAGACIGMGTILHAHEGRIEVGIGANLGAGTLVIGQARIGANACVGPATTVFNCSIEAGQVAPPGSLLGDESRHPEAEKSATPEPPTLLPPPGPTVAASQTASNHRAESSENRNAHVYGQEHLNQFLGKLLPYRQSLS